MREFPAGREPSQAWRTVAHRGWPLSPPPLRPPRPAAPELPVELAAFEGEVDPALLQAAAVRAERLGVGGDEVLRCAGILTPEQIARGLAAHLRLAVDPLDTDFEPRSLMTACAGVLRRRDERRASSVTVAARGTGIRWLARQLALEPGARERLRLVAPERLSDHVRSVAAGELAQEAVYGLHAKRPDHSALGYGWTTTGVLLLALTAAAACVAALAPGPLLIAAEYLLALSFISWTLLRLSACLFPAERKPHIAIPDRHLPIYTVIVPLYREAPVVAKLLRALRALDYPREKLDIKLMLEDDDFETRAAVARLRPGAPFEIISPPRSGPQTKPRALAAALPFVRGSLVTVYDAEDEPDPGQLRDAVAAFAIGPPNLACVQARLSIDNVTDSWFSRHFTAEYAGQFDVFLPALEAMQLPIPLGGTSNHFRGLR